MIICAWIWLCGFAVTSRKVEKRAMRLLSIGNYAEIFCFWPYYLAIIEDEADD